MMCSWLVFIAAAAASVVTTGLVTRFLRQRAILDRPNERSSHTVPTPRGGGWGILAVVLPVWGLAGVSLWLLAGIVVLTAVSWIDDRASLPPGPRLLAQGVAVALGLVALGDVPVFQGWLPWWMDRALVGLSWLWFLNLFNFMDGIDGLAGSEAVSVAGGLALAAVLAGTAAGNFVLPALALAGAALGFLVWNWHPASVFMGDVGSVPVGFGLGWLLFTAAGAGLWPAAVLLPLYFVTDASVTLARRLLAGKPIFQAHREHFYQRAVQGGQSHARVVLTVLMANAALLAFALAASTLGWPLSLLGGAVTLGIVFWRLQRAAMARAA